MGPHLPQSIDLSETSFYFLYFVVVCNVCTDAKLFLLTINTFIAHARFLWQPNPKWRPNLHDKYIGAEAIAMSSQAATNDGSNTSKTSKPQTRRSQRGYYSEIIGVDTSRKLGVSGA